MPPSVTPLDQSVEKILANIEQWLTTVVPVILINQEFDYANLLWIEAFQDGKLPPRSFGTYWVHQSASQLTQNNTRTVYNPGTDTFDEISSMILDFDLELSMFGEDSDDILSKVFLSINTQLSRDFFFDRGFRFNTKTPTIDRTKLVNRKFEDRAKMTVGLMTIYESISSIPRIVQVTVRGTIDDKPVAPIVVTDL